MRAVEILMIVSILMQIGAMIIAIFLVGKTKYMALWIFCIISLALLSLERYFQLKEFAGNDVSDMVFAWVGIVVSLSFSICVLCARFLVAHVDYVTNQRRILEHRLLTAVLRTEERSRASFSRELHDGLGPLLSSAKMSLSALHHADLNDRDREMLKNSTAVIDEAIRSLREISNNLSPHVLNSFGLARGVKNFVDKVGAMHPIPISFTTTLGAERYDSNIEVIIYRVICELINNSLKHAECSEISLSLREDSGLLILDYRDNGKGFILRDVEERGMGLSNIRSRVSSLNGKVYLQSRPGDGMRVKVRVSVNGAEIPHDGRSGDEESGFMEPINEKQKGRKQRRHGR